MNVSSRCCLSGASTAAPFLAVSRNTERRTEAELAKETQHEHCTLRHQLSAHDNTRGQQHGRQGGREDECTASRLSANTAHTRTRRHMQRRLRAWLHSPTAAPTARTETHCPSALTRMRLTATRANTDRNNGCHAQRWWTGNRYQHTTLDSAHRQISEHAAIHTCRCHHIPAALLWPSTCRLQPPTHCLVMQSPTHHCHIRRS